MSQQNKKLTHPKMKNIPRHHQQQLTTYWAPPLGIYWPPLPKTLPPMHLYPMPTNWMPPNFPHCQKIQCCFPIAGGAKPSLPSILSKSNSRPLPSILSKSNSRPLPSIFSSPKLYSTSSSHLLLWVKPVPIGEFSIDEQRQQYLGRCRLRYFYYGAVHCNNLTNGMETFVAKDYYAEGIDQMLRWISRMAVPGNGNSLKKTIHECDFVVWRGTLTRLLISCYDVGSFFDVGIKMACEKYKGTYFIREFATKEGLLRESTRSDYECKSCYAGLKFEQVCTTAKEGGIPNTRAPVNQNNEFIGMFKATLNPPSDHRQNATTKLLPFRLLYAAEIDCLSNKGQYMEMKTQYKEFGNGKGFADKALKWWIQSFLIGISELVIGLHENLILKRIEIHQLNSLPSSFELKVNTATCFAFLHSFLEAVKRYLDTQIEGVILFVERLPKSHEFKFRFILPGSAEAAEYRVLSEEFKAHIWK